MTATSSSPAEEDHPDPPASPEVSHDQVARRLPSRPSPWRVFLSHTAEFRRFPTTDGSYIDKVERAVLAAGHQVGNMEHYRASDGDTGRFDELRVRASHVYVGIYGMRWGTPVPGNPELSYTVQEFEAATAAGIPRLIFVVDEHDDSGDLRLPISSLGDEEHGHRQKAFLRRIQSGGELIIKRFRGPDHLAGLVESSLRELEKQAYLAAGGQAPSPRPDHGPAALDAWVRAHHGRLTKAFLSLPPVQARQVHVPLDVCLTVAGSAVTEGPRVLTASDLAPLLADSGDQLLLLSGDGGTGKTSLAFAIARWWLKGDPDGTVRLPVLLESALAPGETVVERVRGWLLRQLPGVTDDDLTTARVEALMAAKRLIPIVDHLSELPPAARDQLVAALPPGLVVVTSRSDDNGFRERPLSRIAPQRIAVERLQAFFLDYLRRKGHGEALGDDDLMPAQAQLKRIVGDKPITVLLAQMFIDDVIANRQEGLLAGSVPELMLNYIRRLDTPDKPEQRRRGELVIDGELVQRALRVVALRSHEQAPLGLPLYQPLEFSERLAREALMALPPEGLALPLEGAREVMAYLMEMGLLVQPGAAADRLRLPLDPLADHLAAAELLERLEERAAGTRGAPSTSDVGVWESFVAGVEARDGGERERMRGFVLALRDRAMDAMAAGRAMAMPASMPDRLARLALLDPEGERYRLAVRRARKWTWELRASVPSERRDAVGKLAAMATRTAEPSDRQGARDVAAPRLAQALLCSDLSPEERQDMAVVLGLMGNPLAVAAVERLAADDEAPLTLRRQALEALGLAARGLAGEPEAKERERLVALLNEHLRREALDLRITGQEGWAEHDARIPLPQAASRALQWAAAAELPLLGRGPGRLVPMLTLSALEEEGGLRVRTEVVEVPVWRLPLPELPGEEPQQLELVRVPAGTYSLGSPQTERGRENLIHWIAANRDDDRDGDGEALRQVRLDTFALVRHPISQGQWRAVVEGVDRLAQALDPRPGKANPESLWDSCAQPGALAVDSVSWLDCQEWLRRLNRWLGERWSVLGGEGPAARLTLPSESQWEAACRASGPEAASLPFHFGATLDGRWARYDASVAFGPGRQSADAKVKQPGSNGASGLVNRWGLAELHGQVWEWCEDTWHPDPGGQGWPADGQPWREEAPERSARNGGQRTWKVLRGGSWLFVPHDARSALRVCGPPDLLSTTVGFRPACSFPSAPLAV